jgi:collectin sub-family protein 10
LNFVGAFTEDFWIDGSDAVTEGVWYWASTMESFGFTNWGIGEPNNQGEIEDCVELYLLDYVWNDKICNTHNHFICEKE